jgi:hypothetical protein
MKRDRLNGKATVGCAYDFCRDVQPSEAMASRRGQIYRAHEVERGKRRHEPPPPVGAINLAPTGTSCKNPTRTHDLPYACNKAHVSLELL